MGGFGSGFQGTKRRVVEDALVLSIADLFRDRALIPGRRNAGLIRWTDTARGKENASISYESNLQDPDAAWLRLSYNAKGESIDCTIRLETTRPNYGGRRYWFLCQPADGGAPRRVAKLYLPPGARHFGRREDHGLTYMSCQQSGRFRSIFRGIALDTGYDEVTVRWAIREMLRRWSLS
jgi:hypothetical protein